MVVAQHCDLLNGTKLSIYFKVVHFALCEFPFNLKKDTEDGVMHSGGGGQLFSSVYSSVLSTRMWWKYPLYHKQYSCVWEMLENVF